MPKASNSTHETPRLRTTNTRDPNRVGDTSAQMDASIKSFKIAAVGHALGFLAHIVIGFPEPVS